MRGGDQPDYRFSLANERTFLAWIRTSLALLAGSVAIVQLVPRFHSHGVRTAIGAALAAIALMCTAFAYRRWSGNEQAMRHARPLPYTRLLLTLNVAIAVVGLAILILVLFAT
jgi:putative membrane protein